MERFNEPTISEDDTDADSTGELPTVPRIDGTTDGITEEEALDPTVICPIVIPGCARIEETPVITKSPPVLLQGVGTLTDRDRRFIETSFEGSIARLREAYLNVGMTLPVDDAILITLFLQFTPGKVEAMKKLIRCPGLIALPGVDQPWLFYKKLLDANKRSPGPSVAFTHSDGRRFEMQPGEFLGEPNIGETDLELWSPFKYSFGEAAAVSELPVRHGELSDIIRKLLAENSNVEGRAISTHEEYILLQAQAPELLERTPGLTILCEKNPPYNVINEDGEVMCIMGNDRYGEPMMYFTKISANMVVVPSTTFTPQCGARVRSVVG